VLAVTDQQAEGIVGNLSDRRIIRKVMRAHDFLETGSVVQSPMKWIRAGIPTTLELIRLLTALGGCVTLDSSREAVTQFCGCSTDEASKLLHDLRDSNTLTLTGAASAWRWCGPSDAA
jgi:hypothetical protein